MAKTKLLPHQTDLSNAMVQITLAGLYLHSVKSSPECQQGDRKGLSDAIKFIDRARIEVRLRLTPESIKTVDEAIANSNASLQLDNVTQLYMQLPDVGRDELEQFAETLQGKYASIEA